jgi:hypothetical protein
MLKYQRNYKIAPDFKHQEWVISKAEAALTEPIPHITDMVSERSAGGIHDYYSNGDYWWPNPDTPDGLPYIHRDGETNPGNFNGHRMMLRKMRTNVVYLSYAYKLTKEEKYADFATRMLKEFFLDEDTKMNPHLSYAQALPGICEGRGIGIIDTLHLVDVPFAIEVLTTSNAMTEDIYKGLKKWFARYLGWMLTDENGIAEMNTTNNHSVCFFVQAAAFALFTDNERIADFCREHYKHVLMKQMAEDGSFPRELGRTKPYNYSIFVVDNMVSLCQLLSKPEDNLWEYTTKDGRGIKKAIEFITPYILDKSSWPYPKDVMHYDAFPARNSFMVFAGCVLGMKPLLDFYESLPLESEDEEARRNVAVRLPVLWM